MSESTDNYLKAIFSLSDEGVSQVTTTALSEKMKTKASSVTDMLKKLDSRGYVKHKRYHGVSLTNKGKRQALAIIRKHRLWELFLVQKLGFNWNEVHDIAEQLEHIDSEELIKKLDKFLNYPKYDPHGDPIPDQAGVLPTGRKTLPASEMKQHTHYELAAVADSSTSFLNHLKTLKLSLGSAIKLKEKFQFDHSMLIESDHTELLLSKAVADKLILFKSKKR